MRLLSLSRHPFLRYWLLWTAGFIAFPIGGLIGTSIVGPIDNTLSALTGGAISGFIIGIGQTLASSRRLRAQKWIPATTIGMSAGLYLGASAVNYGTSLLELAIMGAINGLVLGTCQALALPRGVPSPWLWATALSPLWALGWIVSTLLLIRVDEQFIVFGASGALVFTMLSGLVLHRILRPPQRTDQGAVPTVRAAKP